MSADSTPAALEARFRDAVLASRTRVDEMWGERCLAYNVQLLFSREATDALVETQQRIAGVEPRSLYEIPREALHVSVVWIIGARVSYPSDRSALWSALEDRCVDSLTAVAASLYPPTITFERIVATDSAIVAVARDDGSMAALRALAKARLPIPPETRNEASIVHTTLFRYRAPLERPKELMELLTTLRPLAPMTFPTLHLQRELAYPSLLSETVAAAPFGRESR